jgi:cell division protein FtsN
MAVKNRRVFELRLGKLGLVLFIIGMSFLLFSGFLIGVVVGKHMEAYPERYASGIMVLIRDRLVAAKPEADDKAADKDAQDPGEEKFNLTFYETLGGKKGGAAQGSRSGDVKNKTPETSAGQAAPVVNPLRKEAPASPVDVSSQTTPPPLVGEGGRKKKTPSAEEPAGATGTQNPSASQATAGPLLKSQPPAGKGRFEIQAAAYREKEQAEALVNKFAALGLSSRVVMKDLPGKGRWFRVIADGFESRESAQEASERMVANTRGLKCVIRASGVSENGN